MAARSHAATSPPGNVSYGDYAAGNASGSDETDYFAESYTLNPGELVEGDNVLAVEIHQGRSSSSDLVIDVELLGTRLDGAGVGITSNTTVKARALVGGEWSALTEATFYATVPAHSANLVVSEIYYTPPGSSEDGDGRSLVYLGGHPELATSWRASAADGGSPGGSDSTTFPGGDLDAYAFGGFAPSISADGAFIPPRNLAADDLTYPVEASDDLSTWEPISGWTAGPATVIEGAFVAEPFSPPTEPQFQVFLRARAHQ